MVLYVVVKMKITKYEWDRVIDLSEIVFQKMMSDREESIEIKMLVNILIELSEKYPLDSRAFASLGDFSNDFSEKLKLYEKAYNLSAKERNFKEMISISTSAFRFCIESTQLEKSIQGKWQKRLLSVYPYIEDNWEKLEAADLLRV